MDTNQSPDGELIKLCANHIASYKAANDLPREVELEDGVPEWDRYSALRKAMLDSKPKTITALVAKARSVKIEQEGQDDSPAACLLDDLLAAFDGADDADILSLGHEIERFNAEMGAICDSYGEEDVPDDHPRMDVLNNCMRLLAVGMSKIPAETHAGMQAKARALIIWGGSYEKPPREAADPDTHLQASLLRDLLGQSEPESQCPCAEPCQQARKPFIGAERSEPGTLAGRVSA